MPARFTWPPKPASTPSPVAVPAAPTVPARRSTLRIIEDVWFGPTIPPLADRIEDEGWAPDDPREYCPRCAHRVGPHEADDTGCGRCRGRSFPWERLVRLGPYRGLLRDVVQEVKFTRWRRLGHDLGIWLGRALNSAIDDAGLDRARCVLVPVPCSFRRRMVRGIDHTLVLTRGVAAATRLPICRALARTHRPTQLSLPASERAANVAGSIRSRRGVDLAGRGVIVIDDVTTTRATLIAATKAVRKSLGSKELDRLTRVWAAVAAATPHPDEREREAQAGRLDDV